MAPENREFKSVSNESAEQPPDPHKRKSLKWLGALAGLGALELSGATKILGQEKIISPESSVEQGPSSNEEKPLNLSEIREQIIAMGDIRGGEKLILDNLERIREEAGASGEELAYGDIKRLLADYKEHARDIFEKRFFAVEMVLLNGLRSFSAERSAELLQELYVQNYNAANIKSMLGIYNNPSIFIKKEAVAAQFRQEKKEGELVQEKVRDIIRILESKGVPLAGDMFNLVEQGKAEIEVIIIGDVIGEDEVVKAIKEADSQYQRLSHDKFRLTVGKMQRANTKEEANKLIQGNERFTLVVGNGLQGEYYNKGLIHLPPELVYAANIVHEVGHGLIGRGHPFRQTTESTIMNSLDIDGVAGLSDIEKYILGWEKEKKGN